MILAIERNTFNYLYKYNQVKINVNQLIDVMVDDLQIKTKYKELLSQFDRALPLFEEDHELLLLEIDKADLEFDGVISLQFKAVKNIFPLTIIGKRLLTGRLNGHITIQNAVFESLVEELKIKRSLDFRKLAVKKLHLAFGVKTSISVLDFNIIEQSVSNILKGLPQEANLYIKELIDYSKTPRYLPDGNLEYLLKIGLIAIRALGRDEDVLEKGPYYKKSVAQLSFINNGSLTESYQRFWSLKDEEFRKSLNNILTQISASHQGIDIFKISYYYIAFKSLLLKKDHNLFEIGSAIKQLTKEDECVASWVLTLIGYGFSFEKLYESLHQLDPDQIYNKARPEDTSKYNKTQSTPLKMSLVKTGKKNEEKQPKLFVDEDKYHKPETASTIITDPKITIAEDLTVASDFRSSEPVVVVEQQDEQLAVTNVSDYQDKRYFASKVSSNVEGDTLLASDHSTQVLDRKTVELSDVLAILKHSKKEKKLASAFLDFFKGSSELTVSDLTEFLELHKKNVDQETLSAVQTLF